MADDKDNSAPDPWAGIDADGPQENDGGFAFSFDAPEESAEPAGFDLSSSAEQADEPIFSLNPEDASAAAAEEDAFSAFSVDATGGEDVGSGIDAAGSFVSTDPVSESSVEGEADLSAELDAALAGELSPDVFPAVGGVDAGDDQAFSSDDLVGSWLEEPAADEPLASVANEEQPLAVFPPADSGVFAGHEEAAEEPGDASEDVFGSFLGVGEGDDTASDAIDASLVGNSSSIQIGTGQSGIVADSDIVPGDAIADTGDEFSAEAFPGFDAEGISGVAAFADAALGETSGDEQPVEGFAFADEAGDSTADALAGFAAAGAVAAPALGEAVAPAKKSRPVAAAKPRKQGGIGQMIGVVLGGLMALPITYAILIWGFGKDPFKFTKMVPEEMAFLLPAKLQPGARSTPRMPTLNPGTSLDSLAATDPGASAIVEQPEADPLAEGGEAPVPGDEPNAAGKPPAPRDDFADLGRDEPAAPEEPVPPPAEPPAPPPLDLSALEAAVDEATAGMDAVVAADDPADPARKKLLVGWYKNLAKVGKELVMLESIAADTGQPLSEPPAAVKGLYERIAATEPLHDDLQRLGRDWVAFKKRPDDGVVLLASFDGARKVGPYWHAVVSLEQADGSLKPVSVISRSEPHAEPGERVAVTGVVFADDVVWAADCQRLAPAAADVSEDLF